MCHFMGVEGGKEGEGRMRIRKESRRRHGFSWRYKIPNNTYLTQLEGKNDGGGCCTIHSILPWAGWDGKNKWRDSSFSSSSCSGSSFWAMRVVGRYRILGRLLTTGKCCRFFQLLVSLACIRGSKSKSIPWTGALGRTLRITTKVSWFRRLHSTILDLPGLVATGFTPFSLTGRERAVRPVLNGKSINRCWSGSIPTLLLSDTRLSAFAVSQEKRMTLAGQGRRLMTSRQVQPNSM